ncbi:hypothetical protein COBT_000005 [Conglomerata obtusa]
MKPSELIDNNADQVIIEKSTKGYKIKVGGQYMCYSKKSKVPIICKKLKSKGSDWNVNKLNENVYEIQAVKTKGILKKKMCLVFDNSLKVKSCKKNKKKAGFYIVNYKGETPVEKEPPKEEEKAIMPITEQQKNQNQNEQTNLSAAPIVNQPQPTPEKKACDINNGIKINEKEICNEKGLVKKNEDQNSSSSSSSSSISDDEDVQNSSEIERFDLADLTNDKAMESLQYKKGKDKNSDSSSSSESSGTNNDTKPSIFSDNDCNVNKIKVITKNDLDMCSCQEKNKPVPIGDKSQIQCKQDKWKLDVVDSPCTSVDNLQKCLRCEKDNNYKIEIHQNNNKYKDNNLPLSTNRLITKSNYHCINNDACKDVQLDNCLINQVDECKSNQFDDCKTKKLNDCCIKNIKVTNKENLEYKTKIRNMLKNFINKKLEESQNQNTSNDKNIKGIKSNEQKEIAKMQFSASSPLPKNSDTENCDTKCPLLEIKQPISLHKEQNHSTLNKKEIIDFLKQQKEHVKNKCQSRIDRKKNIIKKLCKLEGSEFKINPNPRKLSELAITLNPFENFPIEIAKTYDDANNIVEKAHKENINFHLKKNKELFKDLAEEIRNERKIQTEDVEMAKIKECGTDNLLIIKKNKTPARESLEKLFKFLQNMSRKDIDDD